MISMPCSIGEAARLTGISAKMIRHYEQIGLLDTPARTASNYRLYTGNDIDQLHFIRRSRDLGFSMDQIRQLCSLWQNQSRSNTEVKKLTLVHIEELNRRILEMEQMRDALQAMAESCQGDGKPGCPILETIADRTES